MTRKSTAALLARVISSSLSILFVCSDSLFSNSQHSKGKGSIKPITTKCGHFLVNTINMTEPFCPTLAKTNEPKLYSRKEELELEDDWGPFANEEYARVVFGKQEAALIDDAVLGNEAAVTFGAGTAHDFTAPEPLPEESKHRVAELLESGRLFRYQGVDDVAQLEQAFAEYIGARYSVACNSGGGAIFLALRALGVQAGEPVLTCSHTLAPVPGAIVHAAAKPVFVDTDPETLTICLDDLERKAKSSGARVAVISYMRGRVPDIDRMMEIAERCGLTLIEDCAHTLGATWTLDSTQSEPRHLGTFGAIGCWSLQTNKAVNGGEGGLMSTDCEELAAFLTIASGSYGHFALNGASPEPEVLASVYPSVPNFSMRLGSVAAAVALPQLPQVDVKVAAWDRNMKALRSVLDRCHYVRVLDTDPQHKHAWSSVQFDLVGFSASMVEELLHRAAEQGVPLAWFGGSWKGFMSTLKDWQFADETGEQWKSSTQKEIVRTLIDVPLYHTTHWGEDAMVALGGIIVDAVEAIAQK
mmetsp:Transcript_6123/g.10784  ORF Transcript_6123/g.10784 Transcript_6123/m.10784 type:complete len:528 (+) Transcript_6123:92-1675(+)